MTSLVIKQCQNGRSRVARSALEAVRDLFRFLRKNLLGQLDAAVKVLLGLFSFKTDFSAFKIWPLRTDFVHLSSRPST